MAFKAKINSVFIFPLWTAYQIRRDSIVMKFENDAGSKNNIMNDPTRRTIVF